MGGLWLACLWAPMPSHRWPNGSMNPPSDVLPTALGGRESSMEPSAPAATARSMNRSGPGRRLRHAPFCRRVMSAYPSTLFSPRKNGAHPPYVRLHRGSTTRLRHGPPCTTERLPTHRNSEHHRPDWCERRPGSPMRNGSDIPRSGKSSSHRESVRPGHLFVVGRMGLEAAVQDSDQPIGDDPECLSMAVSDLAPMVIESPGSR